MKRSAVAILALIYFAISSGVVVNIHYCMGKMSSAKLQAWAPKSCGCGKKMESKKGCCKTELKVVKLEDAQKASYANFTIHAPVTPLFTELSLLQTPSYTAQDISYPQEHSPPDISKQDTYLRNCVFRI
jgi:hypothetical protein